jgi:uncharacterized RDD family membrane protein YckC
VVLYSISSGLLASVAPVLVPGGTTNITLVAVLALAGLAFVVGGGLFVTFWALVGQTPGMRFLSIHLEIDGSSEIGLRHALRRLFAVPVALLPAGLGFLAILLSPTRRGWHDRIAGTTVVYDAEVRAAPWSTLGEAGGRRSSRARERPEDPAGSPARAARREP